MAFLFLLAEGTQPQRMVSWEAGKRSWKAARNDDLENRDLWDKPNACDPKVLKSSAPLSVLFGMTKVWDRIQKRRTADGRADKPLEIHVLGAAYPFEGRSDWSLLASRKPSGVPRIRVSLILGTPYQSDNVPPMEGKPVALSEIFGNITPKAGKWSPNKEEVVCSGKGDWGMMDVDKGWKKKDFCRDYGNGLEVVCVEKFYQDVRADLAAPDLAVMFSPGFPQLGRRSWDNVLIGLLNDKVPLMLSDVITTRSWGYNLTLPEFGKKPIPPGGKWNPAKDIGEDWQTWIAMKKFGAQRLIARRGPFPILHFEDGGTLAKNAVIQVYEGYKPNRKPTPPLSEDAIKKYEAEFKKVNWEEIGTGDCSPQELKHIFKFPTSRAFDNAVRALYLEDFKQEARHRHSRLTEKQLARLQRLGLIASDAPNKKHKRWNLKAWAFILKTLGCQNY